MMQNSTTIQSIIFTSSNVAKLVGRAFQWVLATSVTFSSSNNHIRTGGCLYCSTGEGQGRHSYYKRILNGRENLIAHNHRCTQAGIAIHYHRTDFNSIQMIHNS